MLICIPQAWGQGPPTGGPGAGSMTFITKVELDVTSPMITIHGQNFGATPTVTIGDEMGMFSSLLDIMPIDDTLIEANLPAGLPPGSYMLVVAAGPGATTTGIFDITLGTN